MMQALGNIIGSLNMSKSVSTSGIWPVWRDSIRAEVVFQVVPRKQATKIWFKARRWDQRTHLENRHGGIIGRAALAVLYTLTHDFLNFRTGRLDPSVASIAKKSSLCERTAYKALRHLRNLGIISWVRRCDEDTDSEGRFRLRQLTNAYGVAGPKDWLGFVDDDPPPPPDYVLGKPDRVPEIIEQAAAALQAGDRHQVYGTLTLDPSDKLAVALAEWGRTLGHI